MAPGEFLGDYATNAPLDAITGKALSGIKWAQRAGRFVPDELDDYAKKLAKKADDAPPPQPVKASVSEVYDPNTKQLEVLQDKCFAPETLVRTPDGQRPIGEIRQGDTVLAYDHRTGEWAERQVEKFHESIYEGPLLTIHSDGGEVRTTVYHPFWVTSGRDLDERSAPRELEEHEDEGLSLAGRWVNSHELRCGDALISQDGQRRTVLKVEQEFVSGFLVHNLTISEDHTFAVGADGVLVHNTGSCRRVEIQPNKPHQVREPLSFDDAVDEVAGNGDVIADSRKYAKEIAEAVGNGPPILDPPHGPGQRPHFHPTIEGKRTGGHVLF